MAVSFDAYASVCSGFSGSALTLSNFTVGAGSNRLIMFMIALESSNVTISNSTLVVKYNGVAMSAAFQVVNTNKGLLALYYLVAPASGSHACLVTYSGGMTISAAQVGVISFAGVDQTTPLAGSNSGAESSANTATYPSNFSLPISGGTYGAQFGYIKYGSSFEGPSDTPTPFTTIDANTAAMVGSGGTSTPGNNFECAHGAYGGGSSNMTWTAHQTGAYEYMAGVVSLNAILPLEFNADTMTFGVTTNAQADETDMPIDNNGSKGNGLNYSLTLNDQTDETDMPIARTSFGLTLNPWQGFVRHANPFPGGFTINVPTRRRRMIWPPPRGLFSR